MKYILFLVAIVAITCAETEDVFDLDKFRIKLPKLSTIIKVVKPIIPIVKPIITKVLSSLEQNDGEVNLQFDPVTIGAVVVPIAWDLLKRIFGWN